MRVFFFSAPGTRIAHYEIRTPLGSGGMGDVYRARDLTLDRDVALKFLPSHLSDDPDRLRRFEQEARAASALNHPAIVAIYELGRTEAQPYISMELVVGQTLRQLLVAARWRPADCWRSRRRSRARSPRRTPPASSTAI
jgi:serine/threonine protein kinase